MKIFDPIFDLLANILSGFYALVHSYGFAIVMLTVVVMAVTTPLTYKGTKSMLKMQQLQPELRRLQTKYKNDRETMNAELLKFYKDNNISPVGGCLPLLVQMPVFIILYRVLNGLTRRITNVGVQAGVTAGAVASSATLAQAEIDTRTFDPKYINTDSELYQSLVGKTEMRSWGIDMSEKAQDALSGGVGHAWPYVLLILLVLATGVYQQRQIAGRATGAPVNSQQQMIMKLMPIFLPIFSFAMPAGLVIYFIISNVWRIGQQAVITRKLYTGDNSLAAQARAARERAEAMADEEVEAKPAPAAAAPKAAIVGEASAGRNRSTMARASRLRALDDAVAGGSAKQARQTAAGASKKAGERVTDSEAPKFQTGRTTPKGNDAQKKKKRK